MPNSPRPQNEPEPRDEPGIRAAPGAGRRPDTRRVVVDPGGPVLVEGPVEVELPDGGTAVSDRFMVAVCACRRSRTYPWCDASHRRRRTPPPGDGRGRSQEPRDGQPPDERSDGQGLAQ